MRHRKVASHVARRDSGVVVPEENLVVVIFYTEGPPQDDGLPLAPVVRELRDLLKPSGVDLS